MSTFALEQSKKIMNAFRTEGIVNEGAVEGVPILRRSDSDLHPQPYITMWDYLTNFIAIGETVANPAEIEARLRRIEAVLEGSRAAIDTLTTAGLGDEEDETFLDDVSHELDWCLIAIAMIDLGKRI